MSARELLAALVDALPKCWHRDRESGAMCMHPATRGTWCDDHYKQHSPQALDLGHAPALRVALGFLESSR